jgi:hypothetical protein
MVIFDLPPISRRGAVRATALGSCRVTNPILVLRNRGDLKICDWALSAHHTAPEALQSLKVVAGELRIPDDLSPYVFETETTPPIDRARDWLREGIDVFVLEVSSDQQFVYGDVLLQQNFVARELVQARRGALLDWYRVVCRGEAPDEECVQMALENMQKGGFEQSETFADLLRGVRLKPQDGAEITRALHEMMSRFGGRWVVVGQFALPGQEGTIMQDRRALNAKLSAAARQCGALFYDPTQLVTEHGNATALDGGGADIYEYAPSFYPTVGESLVNLVREVQPARSRAKKRPPAEAPRGPSLYAKLKKGLARRLRKFRRR